MSNPRSASNAWAKIRQKLADGSEAPPATPKKGGRKPAAKSKATADNKDSDTKDDAADDTVVPETPKKTPRKRAPKKQEVAGSDESPKKKTRPNQAKKVVKKENEAEAKGESDHILFF